MCLVYVKVVKIFFLTSTAFFSQDIRTVCIFYSMTRSRLVYARSRRFLSMSTNKWNVVVIFFMTSPSFLSFQKSQTAIQKSICENIIACRERSRACQRVPTNYIREKAVLGPNLALTSAQEWLQFNTNSWAEDKEQARGRTVNFELGLDQVKRNPKRFPQS